jgi:hypothetical protein|tara:strand:+ start:386 stop:670 length:285 start_codon:yes stop_codon:yes gene_type:complete
MINFTRLQTIKDTVEKMDITHQLQLFNKINENNEINYTENSNGVFINLSKLDEITIKNLENYIDYFNKQQNELQKQETRKNSIKKEFFINDKNN